MPKSNKTTLSNYYIERILATSDITIPQEVSSLEKLLAEHLVPEHHLYDDQEELVHALGFSNKQDVHLVN